MLLEVKNLSKTFESGFIIKRKVRAVDKVSFSIKKGTAFGLMGGSGCGKTTISRMILQFLVPDSGSIMLDGKEIMNLTQRQRKSFREEVQIVFQHPESSLNPQMTIEQNLFEPLRIQHLYNRAEWKKIGLQKLDMVGLPQKLLSRYPHEISGGEAQRIVIARALMLPVKLLILDECTSMLDVSIQAQIMELFAQLQKELGLTYLFISHDLDLIRWLCEDIAVMQMGHIVEQGAIEKILSNPQHEFTKQIIQSSIVN